MRVRVFYLRHEDDTRVLDRVIDLLSGNWIPAPADVELVAEMTFQPISASPRRNREYALETAFNRLQNVDESHEVSKWTIDGKPRRSAMLGDIIEFNGSLYAVDAYGFQVLAFPPEQICPARE